MSTSSRWGSSELPIAERWLYWAVPRNNAWSRYVRLYRFEYSRLAREPSQNIFCNDWKFLTFSPCKKEHNASIITNKPRKRRTAVKERHHSFDGKVTEKDWNLQTFLKVFLKKDINTKRKAQKILLFTPASYMSLYVIYTPMSVRLLEKSTFFLCREDYYHPPPACQGLSIFDSRGVHRHVGVDCSTIWWWIIYHLPNQQGYRDFSRNTQRLSVEG